MTGREAYVGGQCPDCPMVETLLSLFVLSGSCTTFLLPEGSRLSRWWSSMELVTNDPLGFWRVIGHLALYPKQQLIDFSADLITLCTTFPSAAVRPEHHVAMGSTGTLSMVQWQKLLLHFILPESCQGVEPLLPCLVTKSYNFLLPIIWDQFHLSISWTIFFFSPHVQRHLYTQCVWGVLLRISVSLGTVQHFTLEVTNVHRGLAVVTVQWRNASATHIIAYLQESIDPHPSRYSPLSSASLCQLKWSLGMSCCHSAGQRGQKTAYIYWSLVTQQWVIGHWQEGRNIVIHLHRFFLYLIFFILYID